MNWTYSLLPPASREALVLEMASQLDTENYPVVRSALDAINPQTTTAFALPPPEQPYIVKEWRKMVIVCFHKLEGDFINEMLNIHWAHSLVS
jgi:hypothetical protein